VIVLTVYYDPAKLTLNQRLHWRERHRRNVVAKECAVAAWTQAGCPAAVGPRIVHVTSRRARALDADNLVAALKPIIDALFKGRITPDDSPEWVQLGTVTQETAARYRGHEELELRIEERQP
jgi:hypothetical protein